MGRRQRPHYPRMQVELADTSLLPPRRAEVVLLAARGMSAKEIGRELNISPDTVNWHLDEAKDQFHAHSKIDLISQAWMHGLLSARTVVRSTAFVLALFAAFPMARTRTTSAALSRPVSAMRIGRREISSQYA